MRKTSRKFSQSHMLCKVALVAIMLVFQTMLGIDVYKRQVGNLSVNDYDFTVITVEDCMYPWKLQGLIFINPVSYTHLRYVMILHHYLW